MKRPFIVYKRKSGKKRADCYYIGFLDPATGTYPKRISANSLKLQIGQAVDHFSASARSSVEELARIAIAKRVNAPPSTVRTVGVYLENFWLPDGVYAIQVSRSKKPLSVAYLRVMKSNINANVIPWLKRTGNYTLPVHRVTTELIETMMSDMLENGATAKRCNDVRIAIAKPFEELVRKGVLPVNPVKQAIKFRAESTMRQILTQAEVKAFFAQELDKHTRAACLLSATTGLRIGEVIGLHAGDIREETYEDAGGEKKTYYWIELQFSWTEDDKLHSPKKESRGDVPVPAPVVAELTRLYDANPWDTDFVFWGDAPHRPIKAQKLRDAYKARLVAIGIDEKAQQDRGLSFHAWRHYYASHVKEYATKVLRHTESRTTERYSHLTEQERRSIADQATTLLNGVTA